MYIINGPNILPSQQLRIAPGPALCTLVADLPAYIWQQILKQHFPTFAPNNNQREGLGNFLYEDTCAVSYVCE